MKKVLLCILLTAVIISCDEDANEEKPSVQVKYEVITTSDGWFGEYIIETGEKLCTCPYTILPSGWTYSFKATDIPFILHIDATTEKNFGEVGAPDVTTNIYVNNKLVATNTSNWAPGVTSADYVIE